MLESIQHPRKVWLEMARHHINNSKCSSPSPTITQRHETTRSRLRLMHQVHQRTLLKDYLEVTARRETTQLEEVPWAQIIWGLHQTWAESLI
jgi:hypothetical protein